MKQTPKRPRATGKSSNKPANLPAAAESTSDSAVVADVIPPEVYPEPETASAVPEPETAPEPAKAAPEPVAATAVTQPAPAPAASQPAPRSGFVPLLLGGLIAGAIGFAVASLTNPPASTDLEQLVATQDGRITTLEEELAAQDAPDLEPITQAQDDLSARLADVQTELDNLRADMDSQMAGAAEAGGAGPAPDTQAFEAEIAALRTQLNEMTDIARTELDAARAEAASIEENAAAAATAAAGRAALARLQVSIETGAPLGSALDDLQGALGEPVPDTLLAAQDGVPTLAVLQESFPDYARAALTTARAEGVSGEDSTGVGAFLRNQFAVRSVNPRDGDTVDAILSRAQAAVSSGRIADALSEINALPEVARADMVDWTSQAEIRADAVATINTLATSLRDN